jgi:dienelactone hydrolase
MTKPTIRSWGVAMALAFTSLVLVGPARAEAEQGFVRETAASLPGHNIYRPADLTAVARPLPVIVWANGGCAVGDPTWATLFQRWAEAGNFVITIHREEEYKAMAARFAEAQRAWGDAAARTMPAPPPSGAMNKPGSQAYKTAEDQRASIDWAATANETAPYAGKLDLSRVVAAGNSCGGISSLTLASSDPRVKSVFVLSGSSVGPNAKAEDVAPTMGNVRAPVIWVVGGPEDIARAAAELDYSLQPAKQPGVIVYRKSYEHRVVSTDPATLREVAEMGVLWFRATLYGDQKAATELTTKVCAICSADIWSVKAKHIGAAQ